VLLGWRAEALEKEDHGFAVRGAAEAMTADTVIVAVPHARAAGLLAALLPGTAEGLSAMESSPIVNLHVV
jgi:prephenate dehydrogenase